MKCVPGKENSWRWPASYSPNGHEDKYVNLVSHAYITTSE